MKNFIKSNAIILAIFLVISSQSIAGERIFPLAKPKVDNETKKKNS